LIFELAVSLGELLGHLIFAICGATIANSELQKYGLAELEFGHCHHFPTGHYFKDLASVCGMPGVVCAAYLS
jgi:hypothetical protein